jgi:hypothetical protein
MIVAHIEAFINMLDIKHIDLDMHIINLEITHRESVIDIQLCKHCGIVVSMNVHEYEFGYQHFVEGNVSMSLFKDNPNKPSKLHPHIMIWKGVLRLLSSPRWHQIFKFPNLMRP